MAFDAQGVDVGQHLVAALDGRADQGGGFGVHPWFDYFADLVVVWGGFEAVYGEAGGECS